jgi:lipid-binding SYLF domain-containing protein
MFNIIICRAALLAVIVSISACSTAPKSESDRTNLRTEAEDAVKLFKFTDRTMEDRFRTAHGYAVFPDVGKGAAGIGGAYGRGVVYQQGAPVGYCDLSQGTIGLQLGGQSYRELIFFEDNYALERFKRGEFTFAADVSAVAAMSGASAAAKYREGVLVFTMPRGGLMLEASIGGQNFGYQPM